MIEFSSPYLIPIIFMFFVLSVGFGIGAILSEITLVVDAWTNEQHDEHAKRAVRWLLLVIPSLLGIFVILWWPGQFISG
jgi:Na+/H+ antiporter NhaC